jgi:hypothetical protein
LWGRVPVADLTPSMGLPLLPSANGGDTKLWSECVMSDIRIPSHRPAFLNNLARSITVEPFTTGSTDQDLPCDRIVNTMSVICHGRPHRRRGKKKLSATASRRHRARMKARRTSSCAPRSVFTKPLHSPSPTLRSHADYRISCQSHQRSHHTKHWTKSCTGPPQAHQAVQISAAPLQVMDTLLNYRKSSTLSKKQSQGHLRHRSQPIDLRGEALIQHCSGPFMPGIPHLTSMA